MRSNLIKSIYDKNLEIRYNELVVRNKEGKQVKIELKGKIKCPLLNTQISSIVCSKIMDRLDWPRGIDPDICQECNCFVNLSIKRLKDKKSGDTNDKKN
jgi:hypothetical protein